MSRSDGASIARWVSDDSTVVSSGPVMRAHSASSSISIARFVLFSSVAPRPERGGVWGKPAQGLSERTGIDEAP